MASKDLAQDKALEINDKTRYREIDDNVYAEEYSVNEAWRRGYIKDETDNDSNKSWEVPGRTEREIISIRVKYVSAAGGTARQLEILFIDHEGAIWYRVLPELTQAGGNTYYYHFSPTGNNRTALIDTDYLETKIPILFLGAGDTIRVWDNNAVAATTDDMHVYITYEDRTV